MIKEKRQMRLIKLFAIVCLLLTSFHASAGLETQKRGLEGSAIDGGYLDVKDQWVDYMAANSNWNSRFGIKNSVGRIQLWIDRDQTTVFEGDWTVDVTYDVELKDDAGNVINTYTGQSIEVNWTENTSYKDIALKEYQGAMSIRVYNISVITTGVTVIPQEVRLDVSVNTERYYHLDDTEVPIIRHNLNAASNELDLRWSFIEGAESYDVEWVFIDIADASETNDYKVDFRRADRVNVPTNNYNLSLAFPRGIIVYRVRSRGYDITSFNETIGSWSFDPALSISSTNSLPASGVPALQPKFVWDGLDLDKNWQYQLAFSEDGKRKEGISYFDGSLRSRQTSTILNTDDHALVSNSVYDYLGRSALQVLPSVQNSAGIKFYENINNHGTGVYDFSNFDVDGKVANPDPIDDTGTGAGFYWSASNTNPIGHNGDYIPDAEGYPFSRARYKNDGTGRIHSQSGVGATLREGKGHEVKYFYAAPGGQEELDRLFGNEVGEVQQYKKNMVVDPNGQVSVSYIDQNGRTIATALAGESPENLVDIDTRPDAFETIISDLTNFNALASDNSSLNISNSFAVPVTGNYEFHYELNSTDFPACYDALVNADGLNDGISCYYDLHIELTSESGNTIYSKNERGIEKTTLDIDFIELLIPGVYTITKTLTIADGQEQAVWDEFYNMAPLDPSCGLIPPVEVIDADCNPGCLDMCFNNYVNVTASGSFEFMDATGAIVAVKTDTMDYYYRWLGLVLPVLDQEIVDVYDLIALCELDCESVDIIVDDCDLKLKVLKADVSPDGQYFDNIGEVDQVGYDINGWLIDKFGSSPPSGITSSFGTLITTWPLMRALWEDSYADFLVNKHPEFCIHNFYCNAECDRPESDNPGYLNAWFGADPSSSNEWLFNPLNMAFAPSATMPNAYQPYSVYTNTWPNGTLNAGEGYADPWFGVAGGCRISLQSDLESYLLNYIVDDVGRGYSLWYVMNDPEGIASGGALPYSITTSDAQIRGMFEALHGNSSGTIQGLIPSPGDSPLLGQVTKLDFFRSAYNFFRELVIYNNFLTDFCPNNNCLENAVVEGVVNSGCFLDDPDGDLYTDAGYQIRYKSNEAFEAYLSSTGAFAYGITIGNDQCANQCASNSLIWAQDLVDDGCVNSTFLNAMADDLANICAFGCVDDNVGNSSGDGSSTILLGGGTTASNFTEVINYYSILSTGMACSSAPIVYPEVFVHADSQDCDCENIKDFVVQFYDEYEVVGDPLDPLNVLSASDQIDFNEALEEILNELSEFDGTGNAIYTISDVQNWLTQCQIAGPLGAIAEQFDCSFQNAINNEPLTVESWLDDCGQAANAIENYNNASTYNQILINATNEFVEQYKAHCMSSATEVFTMKYDLIEYHYTLYYYDQADNLIKTVPPSGVYQQDPTSGVVLHNGMIPTSGSINANLYPPGTSFTYAYSTESVQEYRDELSTNFVHPQHLMVSNYQYNSLQKLIRQETPDGGISEFWYDALDRIVLSQNAKQLNDNQYSYTLYDELGRVEESGEVTANVFPPGIVQNYESIQEMTRNEDIFSSGGNDFHDFISDPLNPIEEVSRTFYDNEMNASTLAFFDNGQQFLRTRISTVTYEEVDEDNNPDTYDQATHYSYDVHGNVVVLIQENNSVELVGQSLKKMTYDYDLISGNVNQVNYQEGEYDEFYHRYCYDADNRMTQVFTSRDKNIWEQEQKQFYYAHGPIARMETGDRQVQGCDYIYTIQGWLKANNSSTGNKVHDAGKDGLIGSENEFFGEDALGYELNYFLNHPDFPVGPFNSDYKSIGLNANAKATSNFSHADLTDATYDLYNGNIGRMVVGMKDENENPITMHANRYQYDQLNRIKGMDVYKDDAGNDPYASANLGFSMTNNDDYHSEYSFDGNGNLHFLKRNAFGSNQQMDEFSYKYKGAWDGSNFSAKTDNKLDFVPDQIPANFSLGFGDIQPGQSFNNYNYDEIGQLIYDQQECIQNIEWDVRNKVLRIERDPNCAGIDGAQDKTASDVEFHYNALGQRTHKIELTKDGSGVLNSQLDWVYTYYIRDAEGNVMGVYKRTFENEGLPIDTYNEHFELIEHQLYGADRLGLATNEKMGVVGEFTTDIVDENGYDVFDLSMITYNSITSPLISHEDEFQLGTLLFNRQLGDKTYELKNHLGNVLEVINDRRLFKIGSAATVFGVDEFSGSSLDGWSGCSATAIANVGGELRVTITGFSTDCAFKTATFTTGATYELTIDIDPGTTPLGVELHISNLMADIPLVAGSNTVSFTITDPAASSIVIRPQGATLGTIYYSLDNVELKQLSNTVSTLPDVLSYNDYYPYGSLMPGRHASTSDYRYGFQGQEKDDEVKGEGNSVNYKYRMHDPRLGRFFAVDPLAGQYQYNSPYAFSENEVINAVELEGTESTVVTTTWSDKLGYPKVIDNSTDIYTYTNWYTGDGIHHYGLTGTLYLNVTPQGKEISKYFVQVEKEQKTSKVDDNKLSDKAKVVSVSGNEPVSSKVTQGKIIAVWLIVGIDPLTQAVIYDATTVIDKNINNGSYDDKVTDQNPTGSDEDTGFGNGDQSFGNGDGGDDLGGGLSKPLDSDLNNKNNFDWRDVKIEAKGDLNQGAVDKNLIIKRVGDTWYVKDVDTQKSIEYSSDPEVQSWYVSPSTGQGADSSQIEITFGIKE